MRIGHRLKLYKFFQAAIVSILLYRYTTWTLTKCMEKKLGANYIRMLRAILKKSLKQHPTHKAALNENWSQSKII